MSNTNKTLDRWKFIQEWLPDYSTNEAVAYSNDLDCYIHGETGNSQYYKLKETFPDIEDAIVEQEYVDSELFAEAYDHYVKAKEQELERKREEAKEKLPAFQILVRLTYGKVIEVHADNTTEAQEMAERITMESGVNLHEYGFDLDSMEYEVFP